LASYGWIPEDEELPRGKWDSEQEVKTSLYARMEYFLTMIVEEEFRLPDNIIADLTNRLKPLVTASTACADAGGRRVVIYIYLCAYLRVFDDNVSSRRQENAQTQ